jgi:Leucine-rich repeat (LRR) protein
VGLKSLKILRLDSNQFTDITPLTNLTDLSFLELTNNELENMDVLHGIGSIKILKK